MDEFENRKSSLQPLMISIGVKAVLGSTLIIHVLHEVLKSFLYMIQLHVLHRKNACLSRYRLLYIQSKSCKSKRLIARPEHEPHRKPYFFCKIYKFPTQIRQVVHFPWVMCYAWDKEIIRLSLAWMMTRLFYQGPFVFCFLINLLLFFFNVESRLMLFCFVGINGWVLFNDGRPNFHLKRNILIGYIFVLCYFLV